jgi:hypothetical protein
MGAKVGPRGGRPGKRVNIYLPPESVKIAKQIDNLSEFIQLALDQAASIMAFDIIKKHKGIESQPPPTQDAVDQWNRDHPLNPLTQRRMKKYGPAPNPIPADSPLSD